MMVLDGRCGNPGKLGSIQYWFITARSSAWTYIFKIRKGQVFIQIAKNLYIKKCFFFLITKLSFPLAIFSLFFHFQLFKSLVIWNSFVRINGNIWYLSIHVWTTLMLSQAKLDIWLPRVYGDDGDGTGDDFLEQDHQHRCHDQHLAPECSPELTHQTSFCSSHKSSFPPSGVE